MSTSKQDAPIPSIVSLKDLSGKEIPDGGTTTDTSVIIAGLAEKMQRVEVLDGAMSSGLASVDSAGNWMFQMKRLSVGAHSVTAKALYGAGAVSAARTFTVVLK